MIYLYSFLVFFISFLIFLRAQRFWLIHLAKRKGIPLEKGKTTLFDVRRLILQNEYELAIWLYRHIYNVNERDAQKAVKELERSIQEKKLKP